MVIVREQNEALFYGQKLNLKLGNGPRSKEIHNTNIELALSLLRVIPNQPKNTVAKGKTLNKAVLSSNKLSIKMDIDGKQPNISKSQTQKIVDD